MNILAIDTSAKVTSVAIVNETQVLAEYSIDTRLTHSQSLMPMVHSVTQVSGIELQNIDGFCVAVGPGSFTGLRISIGAVKGMAYALNCPCVGVSTLNALAMNMVGVDGIICPAMDARCNQVYTALFECIDGKISRLSEDMAISTAELLIKLKEIYQEHKKTIFFVGDGADLCYNKFIDELDDIKLADPARRYQHSSSVGFVAMTDFLTGNTQKADELMPTYLRLPQAQRELLAKKDKGGVGGE